MARLKTAAAQFSIAIAATLEATQRAIVTTAKREHAKIMAADPRPGSFRRYVDSVEGAKEEAVKPFGVIQYDYMRLDLVVQFAMETLFDRSPVDSGDYRRAHTLFLNGEAVSDLKDWKPGDYVSIVNSLPYARVIENGKMKMRVAGTDGVYAAASLIVSRRFGNLAKVYFDYIGVVGGQTGRNGKFDASNARFPALVIAEL